MGRVRISKHVNPHERKLGPLFLHGAPEFIQRVGNIQRHKRGFESGQLHFHQAEFTGFIRGPLLLKTDTCGVTAALLDA